MSERKKCLRDFTDKWKSELFLFVPILITAFLITCKAKFDLHYLYRMMESEFRGAKCPSQNMESGFTWNRMGCIYDTWLSPISLVDVQFQNSGNLQRELLHLGVTSDFVLLWQIHMGENEGSSIGRPLVVPKVSIRAMASSEADTGPTVPIPTSSDSPDTVILLESAREPLIERFELIILGEFMELVRGDDEQGNLERFVASEMGCSTETPEKISELILFEHDSNEFRERQQDKIRRFVDDLDPGDTVLRVFGFASADGHRERNLALSGSRATQVTDALVQFCANSTSDCPPFDAEAVWKSVGEDHFINGVANSRSAVIVVCDCAV